MVTIGAGAVKNADTTDSSGNVTTGATQFGDHRLVHGRGPTAELVNPGQSGTIDINLLNDRNWIDIVFDQPDPSTGLIIDQASITNVHAEVHSGRSRRRHARGRHLADAGADCRPPPAR